MEKQAVLITGTSTGIGKAIAEDLCQRGYHVFAGVRKMKDADSLVASGIGQITPILLDVTEDTSIEKAVKEVSAATGGKLYCLINNAGVAPGGPLEMLPMSDIRQTMDVNVLGPFAMIKATLPLLRANKKARIINMSSIAGLIALPTLSCYAASKHALEAMTDSLRLELSSFNIALCSIEPGTIQTPIWDKGNAMLNKLLEQNDTEIAELYTPFLNYMKKMGERPIGIPVKTVVAASAKAVTSRRPENRYLVGMDAKALKVIGKLPDIIRDKLILSAF